MSGKAGKGNAVLTILVVLLIAAVGMQSYYLYKMNVSMDAMREEKVAEDAYEDEVEENERVVLKSTRPFGGGYDRGEEDPFGEVQEAYKQMSELLCVVMRGFRGNRLFDDGMQDFDYEFEGELQESEKQYILEIHVPDIREDSVNVELMDNRLRVSGVNEESIETRDAEERVVHSERKSVVFSRLTLLPGNADAKTLKQTLVDGILTITVDKAEQ